MASRRSSQLSYSREGAEYSSGQQAILALGRALITPAEQATSGGGTCTAAPALLVAKLLPESRAMDTSRAPRLAEATLALI
jgi:hypothetical protein